MSRRERDLKKRIANDELTRAERIVANIAMFVVFVPIAGVVLSFQAGPVVVPLAIGFFVGITADHLYSPTFYQITAQVIPILFLALAVDLQAFSRRVRRSEKSRESKKKKVEKGKDAIDRLFDMVGGFYWLVVAAAFIALVFGEAIALLAVAHDNSPGRLAQGVVLGACFSGIAMTGAAAVSREKESTSEQARRDEHENDLADSHRND